MEALTKKASILDKAAPNLSKFLAIDNSFLRELVARDVITNQDRQIIEHIPIHGEKVDKLLDIIKRTTGAYDRFMDLLNCDKTRDLHSMMKGLEEQAGLHKHKTKSDTITAQPAHYDLEADLVTTILKMVESAVKDEGQISIRGRTIHYKAKGRFHSLKEPWVYDGTMWDVESGISETARHYNSTQGAIEHATLKLLERLKRDGIL